MHRLFSAVAMALAVPGGLASAAPASVCHGTVARGSVEHSVSCSENHKLRF